MGNPIFSNSSTFDRRPAGMQAQFHGYSQQMQQPGFAPGPYGQQAGFAPHGYPQQGFQHPGYQQPQQGGYQDHMSASGGVMTLDDVLLKTGITLTAIFAVAAASFVLLPTALLWPVGLIASLVGIVVVFMVARRRTMSATGVMIYALVEGVFVGALTKLFEMMFPGIAMQAVLATFMAAGATLAVYKLFNIRVSNKFNKFLSIALFAVIGLLLVNVVFALFGVDLGISAIGAQAGPIAYLVSGICLVLAVLSLISDFDQVERGIENRAPASESWRAALGIAVTLVWLYTEILRVLSYFRD